MAEVVNVMPKFVNKHEPGKFDKYFDGQIWKLTEGEDYPVGGWLSFQRRLRQAGYTRGLVIRSSSLKPHRYIQAFSRGHENP